MGNRITTAAAAVELGQGRSHPVLVTCRRREANVFQKGLLYDEVSGRGRISENVWSALFRYSSWPSGIVGFSM